MNALRFAEAGSYWTANPSRGRRRLAMTDGFSSRSAMADAISSPPTTQKRHTPRVVRPSMKELQRVDEALRAGEAKITAARSDKTGYIYAHVQHNGTIYKVAIDRLPLEMQADAYRRFLASNTLEVCDVYTTKAGHWCEKTWVNHQFAWQLPPGEDNLVLFYLEGPQLNTTRTLMRLRGADVAEIHIPNPCSFDAIAGELRKEYGAVVVDQRLVYDVPVELKLNLPGTDTDVYLYRQPSNVALQHIDRIFHGVWLDYTGTFSGTGSYLHYPLYDCFTLFQHAMITHNGPFIVTFSHRDETMCHTVVPHVLASMASDFDLKLVNTCTKDPIRVTCDGHAYTSACQPGHSPTCDKAEDIRAFMPWSPESRRRLQLEPYTEELPYNLDDAVHRYMTAAHDESVYSYGIMQTYMFRVLHRKLKTRRELDQVLISDALWAQK